MAATQVFATSPTGLLLQRGTIAYGAVCPGQLSVSLTTEAQTHRTIQTAGEFSKLTMFLSANALVNALIVTFRINSGDGSQTFSISGGTTGWFEDSTNTDTVSGGEEVDIEMDAVAGGSPLSATLHAIGVAFAADTNTVTLMGVSSGAVGINSASSTGHFAMCGAVIINGTEANNQIRSKTAATLRELFANITANTRTTDTTFRSRVGGANGNQTFTVSGSSTGLFQDTSNSDTLAVDSLFNMSWTTSTGTGSVSVTVASMEFETTNDSGMQGAHSPAGIAQAATDTTTYKYPQGHLTTATTTSTLNVARARNDYTASFLQMKISANTALGTTTAKFRINDADGTLVLTAATLTTGWFQDASNDDAVVAGDDINYLIDTDGASGSITFTHIGHLATYSSSTTPVDREWIIEAEHLDGITQDHSIPTEHLVAIMDANPNILGEHLDGIASSTTLVLAEHVRFRIILTLVGTGTEDLTDLQYAVFEDVLPENWIAPVTQGNDGTTDGDSIFQLYIGGAYVGGDLVYVYITDTDGTVAPMHHHGGPIAISTEA